MKPKLLSSQVPKRIYYLKILDGASVDNFKFVVQ